MLVTHGYELQCAASFADAQHQCRANEPELLLIGVTQAGRARSAPDQDLIGNAQQGVGFLLNEGKERSAVHCGILLLPCEAPTISRRESRYFLERRATRVHPLSAGVFFHKARLPAVRPLFGERRRWHINTELRSA